MASATGPKAYIAGHDIYYRGFREGKGIWGLRELPNESGGFHIWPLGEGEANRIMRARKSPRQWRQLRGKHECEFPLIPGRRESQAAAASTRD